MKASRLVKILFAAALVFALALPAMAADYTIKVGTIVSESHPDYICMKDVFKPYVEKNSNGKIKVELYPNSQLGGDREMSESVQLGTIQIALPATSAIAGFDKRFQVLDLPFLFKSRESAFKALDGELGKKLDSYLAPLGFANLGYFENGFRHVTNSRKAVYTPADMKGLKLRTMENPMHIAFFKLLGANPTPMNFGELYTALQQKTVDGEENPVAIVETVVDKKGSRKNATDYLNWLWSPEAQEIAAKHHLRPQNPEILAKYSKAFPAQQTFTVDELLGGWSKVLKTHFNDGGFYDQALAAHKK